MRGWRRPRRSYEIVNLRSHAHNVGDQSQDREGARPRSAAHAARPRRRGDRVADMTEPPKRCLFDRLKLPD
jgi:hypothetical protein